MLAVGSEKGFSVYTLVLENDLPTWSLKWSAPYVLPSVALLRPNWASSQVYCARQLCAISHVHRHCFKGG